MGMVIKIVRGPSMHIENEGEVHHMVGAIGVPMHPVDHRTYELRDIYLLIDFGNYR